MRWWWRLNQHLDGLPYQDSTNCLNPCLASIFCSENVVCFLRLLHVFKCTSLVMEVNTLNPDQTDLGSYYLPYRLPKNMFAI